MEKVEGQVGETPQQTKEISKTDTAPAAAAANNGDASGLGNVVAKHYNELQESGLEARVQSRIFYMRNLNNWIKSVLISEFIQNVQKNKSGDYPISVLDLCSGKGGDLLKWKKGKIGHLICADIAATSVEQCESRFDEMVKRNNRERYPSKMFTAEFIAADCAKTRLKEMYKSTNTAIDLTSCQFSFHYSFESYEQADRMLQNACECLKPGGYFIGSTPNAYELVKRWRAAEGNTFGNEIYRVTFDSDNKEDIPLFGAKYMFHLEGVVDCPEFLVNFPAFIKLAEKHGMKLVLKKTFSEFVEDNVKRGDHRSLLGKMQALEPFPPEEDIDLMSKDADAYTNAKESHEKLRKEAADRGDHEGKLRRMKVGTLSKGEWEATTLYLVFAFQKEGGPEPSDQVAEESRKRTHEASGETTTDTHEQNEGETKMRKFE